MEKLKVMIPDHLKQSLFSSAADDLPFTCSALLDHLHSSRQFQKIVKQLSDPDVTTCGKDQVAASQLRTDGNAAFAQRDYQQALNCYTQALRCIPLSMDKIDKSIVATLHFNRAFALRKIGMLKESLRDCSRAIKFHPSHSKAWYCKGQANAGLQNFEDAINDMHTALEFEESSLGKKQVRCEIESVVEQSKRAKEVLDCQRVTDQDDIPVGDNDIGVAEVAGICMVSTEDKGWEIQAENIVLPGDLVLREEPYVAVILKQFRDTHCHFCFKELPGDPVPCESCAIPLYCSENCREHAGGSLYGSNHSENFSFPKQILDDSDHRTETTCLSENDLFKISQMNIKGRNWPEHKHECGGVSWPAVLPTEAVLATRMLIKSIDKESQWYLRDCSTKMNLCHHYEKMEADDKLELHIFAIVLACCLQSLSSGMFQLTGTSISEIVLLIAQVKVNAMAIVHMSSPDATIKSGISVKQDVTCSIKQVQVAQAIYLRGSTFNHSCDPNLHASFVSRSLVVRAIKPLTPGSPLELCYGPQVGESGLEERQRWLKKRYFFICKCMGCSVLNVSDLYFSSFRCAKDYCQGVILDKEITKWKKAVGTDVVPCVTICTTDINLPADEKKKESVNTVASLLLSPENVSMRHISPGCCLRCGFSCDLERKKKVANGSLEYLQRVYSQIHGHGDKQMLLDDALQSLHSLSSMLHAFNKEVAKAEDMVAEMFCLTLQPQSALHHCEKSVQILERLYHSDHIVVANELVKLVSIALMLNKYECAKKNHARINNVFTTHYGGNYAKMFPYLRSM